MNGFWKKRLPALLLALILVLGSMPMALATEASGGNTPGGGSGSDDTQTTPTEHTHSFTEYVSTDSIAKTHTYRCSDKNCDETETTDCTFEKSSATSINANEHTLKCTRCEKTAPFPHTFDDWTSTASEHSRTCSGCAYVEKASHSGLTYSQSNITATQHAATCGVCKATLTAENHKFDDNGKCTVCNYQQPATTWTVTFYTNPANPGSSVTRTVNKGSTLGAGNIPAASMSGYTFMGWKVVTAAPTAVSSYIHNGAACTTSNALASQPINANVSYAAVFQATITGQSAAVNAGTTNGKVVGSDIYSQINSKFKAFTGTDLTQVTFSNPGSSTSGILYVNSNMGSTVTGAFSASSLLNLYFVPGVSGTYTISFTASDNYNTVAGTLSITATANTKISYSAAPGKSVNFKDSDFFTIFKARTGSSDLRYVTFSVNENEFNSFDGSVYAGSTLLNKDNLKNSYFYYTDSHDGEYPLSGLVFQVDNGAKSGKLTLTFTAYGNGSNNSNVSAAGTVELTINGTADGEIVYEVSPGGKVSLDPEDFNNAYQSLSGTNRDIRYVSFSAPSAYSTFNGNLTCGSDVFAQRDLTYDKLTFYYRSNSDDYDYDLSKVSFEAGSAAKDGDSITIPFRAYYSVSDWQSGTLKIEIKGDGGDISYRVLPNQNVTFSASDFNLYFRKSYPGYTLSYVMFDLPSANAFAQGGIYYDYGKSSQISFTRTSLDDERFYYNPGSKDYGLDRLTFAASSTFKDDVKLDFTAYGTGSRSVTGTLVITSSDSAIAGDVSYTVAPGQKVDMKRTDFNTFFRKNYDYTLDYIVFSRPDSSVFVNGSFYANYGTSSQVSFTQNTLAGKRFYYTSASAGKSDYYLDDLSFVAGTGFQSPVSLSFTAYDSNSHYVEGKLTISPDGSALTSSSYTGSIRYSTTSSTSLQINANDLALYYAKAAPGQTLQYVTLSGVPAAGALYYNYYGASSYGTSAQTQITAANCSTIALYHSPTATAQYSLTELTYVPSGTNYCATIPFIAYGTGAAITGSILISVNSTAVPEVYGVVQRNGSIDLPASSIYNAILAATGTPLSGIQLLSLPSSAAGTLYLGSASGTPANTSTVYTYAAGSYQMSLLRFIPAVNYTGSVEIPYVALNSSGTAIACGTFSIGVVGSVRTFTDMSNSTWCYKYVTELSDAGVISGYADGSFMPNSTVTYGAALKLIMLAAGYSEQAPTGSNVFSGYLDRARADGIITRSNVDLSAPITRLQMAQIAAGAMKLSTTNLSSVKPFTDTSDVYVQALNAAGIVEGYFDNGTSTFKPSSTLTRGQISAIVWRMNQYRK